MDIDDHARRVVNAIRAAAIADLLERADELKITVDLDRGEMHVEATVRVTPPMDFIVLNLSVC